MILSQSQANQLIAALKEALQTKTFVWTENKRDDEEFKTSTGEDIRFILTLKRHPFEIKLHLRTKDRHLGLVRLDCHQYHANPDGTEIRGQPHLHTYREGFDNLEWAEPVDWCDLDDPIKTLEHFLREINGRFPNGVSLTLL